MTWTWYNGNYDTSADQWDLYWDPRECTEIDENVSVWARVCIPVFSVLRLLVVRIMYKKRCMVLLSSAFKKETGHLKKVIGHFKKSFLHLTAWPSSPHLGPFPTSNLVMQYLKRLVFLWVIRKSYRSFQKSHWSLRNIEMPENTLPPANIQIHF
jgi:hypothetical protein